MTSNAYLHLYHLFSDTNTKIDQAHTKLKYVNNQWQAGYYKDAAYE